MNRSRKKIALIGSEGMLAAMVRRRVPEGVDFTLLDLPGFDLTDRAQVLRVLEKERPGIILNCAAYTDVDGCETNEMLATEVNGKGPGYLAEAAGRTGATLVHVSTDYVFDGEKKSPYIEEDAPAPRSAYGRSKLCGEQAILGSGIERFFIVRTSWLYGPGGKNFVETIARLAGEREELRVVSDQVGTPTYTEDLADALFRLLETDRYGIYHFANEGQCSWFDFARAIVERLQAVSVPLKVRNLRPVTTEEYPLPAPRPAWSVFSKERYRRATGAGVPDWQSGLDRYFEVRSR